jgi:16S rRNA (guanine527-N7)-methyltransferase
VPDSDPALVEALRQAAALGYLGPGPVAPHIVHARRFLEVLRPAGRLVDLGSGGGVPGLVLAAALADTDVVLLDAGVSRTDFLRRVVARLGWAERVTVVTGRAEEVGRDPAWRGSADAVVARSFGDPAVTAEGAAPLLRVGGQLVVSEPPVPVPDRWPAEGLEVLGLVTDEDTAPGFVSFTQVRACPDRFPRRRMRPPLFHVKPA